MLKKKIVGCWLLVVGLSLMVFVSCSNQIKEETVCSYKSDIGKKILELKQNGLLDNITESKLSRNVVNKSEEDILLEKFINNTDEIIEELEFKENGNIELSIIDALFNNGSIDDIYEALYQDSPDLADNFMEKMEESNIFENCEEKEITTNFYEKNNNRSIFDSDFKTDTILWYAGICAATTAGCVATCSIRPLVKIAGYVAATAGAASMCCQLACWATSTYIYDICKDLKNGKIDAAILKLNSNNVKKGICYSLTLTITTITACAFTPAGKKIIGGINESCGKVKTAVKDFCASFNKAGKAKEVAEIVEVIG